MTDTQATSSSIFSTAWNDAAEEGAVYSQISTSALLAALFGMLSFLAFITPWLCFLSVLGIAFAVISLFAINRSCGILTGVGLAKLGLAFSLISLVAIGTLWPTYHYLVRKEADRFFRTWFQQLAKNNIQATIWMNDPYWNRSIHADAETWWQEQYSNEGAHEAIHRYMDNRLIRVLLSLGNRATVSYYKTLVVAADREKNTVESVYAVTYVLSEGARKGQTETFFVKMVGIRQYPDKHFTSAGWALVGQPAFYVPEEFMPTETKSPSAP